MLVREDRGGKKARMVSQQPDRDISYKVEGYRSGCF